MRLNQHYLRADRPHAFLSASKPHWINYDEDKLDRVFFADQAAQRGTRMHKFAAEAIELKQKLPDNGTTMSMYVNDAIGFMLKPEHVLFVSENCYGTADALGFKEYSGIDASGLLGKLRVHDLKTGITQTSFKQLNIYSAMFCLEYGLKPFDLEFEHRIYQNDDIKIEIGDQDFITHIMDKIRVFDARISALRKEF